MNKISLLIIFEHNWTKYNFHTLTLNEKKTTLGSKWAQNCLASNILQNIFCVSQKKQRHIQVWNNISKWWQNCHFWWIILFNTNSQLFFSNVYKLKHLQNLTGWCSWHRFQIFVWYLLWNIVYLVWSSTSQLNEMLTAQKVGLDGST